MADRVRVIVALSGSIPARAGASWAQRLAEQRAATTQVKKRVMQRLQQLRLLDPDLKVFGLHLFTPMLEIETTQEVIDTLATDADILRITPEASIHLQAT